ncbi:MAG: hypothetical protein UT54_C0026G0009 [Candidatus Daviesbacteria bacterium GW2011_GWB1_39_5]|uniref:Uncharacterized protein n=1 Tax=Candidatus Daviesbacteria bacterium GW2011_GWC2_40_12 TaxID=1618431 RepID=A0A0G0TWE7_9BACT|nr:MAG: hypothetical protein UT45_C0006G0020 [Candidatus Daviesbacteria bacterium GW2011_GWA2_39_33]KKR24210.1 MAG: hypothetical protein UT54_C0026G0009 [Candidatus Daviesbacteria bacterium GW2011_GWB1_39_5]KKR42282.1 MAG: hypothetical protein UT77_C0003G0077 [Candidatus Daviesbacteria bacterium GW2011_GWC2_40_12]OGE22020.1 MAG: hypothetical protein A2778_01765 [Candidatus Daviesbacteria bacterium RIFCSPHIGHO2_01_FULL_40_24]OGE28685.1 MAG: hypothetical protein A3C29_03860 [Candidatus Daviesbact
MHEPVPKGIIESADPTPELHRKASDLLNQGGYTTTPVSVNPNDQSPLENIRDMLGNATYVVGSTIKEQTGGGGLSTGERSVEGSVPVTIASGKRFLQKEAA